MTNLPSLDNPVHPTLHALVKSLNPVIVVENSPDPYGPIPSTSEFDATWYEGSELFQAVDLMKRCLDLDCTKRCEWREAQFSGVAISDDSIFSLWGMIGTAEECLEHPFFDGMYDVGGGKLGPRSVVYM